MTEPRQTRICMPATAKKVLSFVGFCVACLLVIELAVQLRMYAVRSAHSLSPASGQQLHVVIIGDSVVGDEGNPNSLFSLLKTALLQKTHNRILLINESTSANSSSQASRQIDSILATDKPALTLLLLGNSDFLFDNFNEQSSHAWTYLKNHFLIQSKVFCYLLFQKSKLETQLSAALKLAFDPSPAAPQTGLSELEYWQQMVKQSPKACIPLARVALAQNKLNDPGYRTTLMQAESCANAIKSSPAKAQAYNALSDVYDAAKDLPGDLRVIHLALEQDPNNLEALENLAWTSDGAGDCNTAIAAFEKLFARKPASRRGLHILKKCYFKEQKLQQGATYFANLSGKFPQAENILGLLSAVLEMPESPNTFDKTRYAETRDHYLSMLFYYKINHMDKAANELFLKRDKFEMPNDSEVDFVSYSQVVQKAFAAGSSVMALQYPNQPLYQLAKAVNPLDQRITLFPLGSIFERHLQEHAIFDLLDIDLFHLSPLGAKVIAEGLSEQVLKELQWKANP
jgi:lysophospholipase L1-like esterase